MPETDSAIETVGIAGGGQLAQMMLPAAADLGLKVVVLDPDPNCSASGSADVVVGGFDSVEALHALAARCDVVTFEIEKISIAGLKELEDAGVCVRPSATVLEIIQDKLRQKEFLREHGIPTSHFLACSFPGEPALTLPCVWKARRDGYDGRGVAVLRTAADVQGLPPGDAMLEELVDIEIELATLIARAADGELVHYPVAEIVMDADAHVMDTVIVPAAVDQALQATCTELARQVAEALDYVGILALEFFVTRGGQVQVNEISPRPHNSGHYTIEACATSQFEQHLRAVAERGLGSSKLRRAALTFNVLGASGANGRPRYVGFDEYADDEGIHVHCYDKPEVRPGRKMAHVTVLGDSREAVLSRAAEIKPGIRVEAAND